MNTDQKTKWIAALRSGKYNQGKKVLYYKRTDSYCCLGVACKILDISSFSTTSIRSGNIGTLDEDAMFLSADVQRILMTMNDAYGKSFSEIASYIESNVNPS